MMINARKNITGKSLESDWEVGRNLGMVVSENFLEEVTV